MGYPQKDEKTQGRILIKNFQLKGDCKCHC